MNWFKSLIRRPFEPRKSGGSQQPDSSLSLHLVPFDLEDVPYPQIVFDETGKILKCNHNAEVMYDDLELRNVFECIFADPDLQRELVAFLVDRPLASSTSLSTSTSATRRWTTTVRKVHSSLSMPMRDKIRKWERYSFDDGANPSGEPPIRIPTTISSIDRHQQQQHPEAHESFYELVVTRLTHESSRQTSRFLITQRDITTDVEIDCTINEIMMEHKRVLLSLFPKHIVETLAKSPNEIHNVGASSHDDVAIMFLDIVGFTKMCSETNPSDVMAYLSTLFNEFDELIDKHDSIYKVETAGDCYIAACGILKRCGQGYVYCDRNESAEGAEGSSSFVRTSKTPAERNTAKLYEFAKEVLRRSMTVCMPNTNECTRVRIGIHTGPCTSGIIGIKQPKFSIFGDTMNVASRMESTCAKNRIQLSETSCNALPERIRKRELQSSSGVDVKGKGFMRTFVTTEDAVDCIVPPRASFVAMSSRQTPNRDLFATTQKLRRLVKRNQTMSSLLAHDALKHYARRNTADGN